MFIQNVSMDNIRKGFHMNPGPNCMLIQIVDPGHEFPKPLYDFKEVHRFEFLDVEIDDGTPTWDFRPTQEQADELVELLAHARQNRMDVIVHCHAGLCRSGAVCEIGVIMGFGDTEVRRSPNTYLKGMMMKSLGLSYDTTAEYKTKYDWLFDSF